MKIAIDFDGTCVTHDYPGVGKDIGAVPVLKRLAAAGHRLILNTMRCGKELQDAAGWFKANGIPLYGVNEDPGQKEWTQSPKVFANLYIDDAALGVPLKRVAGFHERFFVDWEKAEKYFERGLFSPCPGPADASSGPDFQEGEMTGKGILAGWLKEHGYDGLCGDRDCSDGCGCAFDDFMPCEHGGQGCIPAYEYRPVENAETRCPDFRNCEERHGGCLWPDYGTHVLSGEDRRCMCRRKREGA